MKSRLAVLLLLLLLVPVFALAADPVVGVDYVEIPDGKPFAPSKGKVEVAEVFGYSCIHCFNLESTLDQWKKKQPAFVKFAYVPAAFGGYWSTYARAFFAAQQLGVLERSHAEVFKAVHVDGSLPVQNVSNAELAAFYGRFGVTPKAFAASMESAPVDALLERSRAFAMAAGVEGTPTLIVAGKYRITARSFDDALRTTEYLVARERSARK